MKITEELKWRRNNINKEIEKLLKEIETFNKELEELDTAIKKLEEKE